MHFSLAPATASKHNINMRGRKRTQPAGISEEQQKQMTTAAQLLEAAKHLRALAFRHTDDTAEYIRQADEVEQQGRELRKR
jgi:hypothetical protein